MRSTPASYQRAGRGSLPLSGAHSVRVVVQLQEKRPREVERGGKADASEDTRAQMAKRLRRCIEHNPPPSKSNDRLEGAPRGGMGVELDFHPMTHGVRRQTRTCKYLPVDDFPEAEIGLPGYSRHGPDYRGTRGTGCGELTAHQEPRPRKPAASTWSPRRAVGRSREQPCPRLGTAGYRRGRWRAGCPYSRAGRSQTATSDLGSPSEYPPAPHALEGMELPAQPVTSAVTRPFVVVADTLTQAGGPGSKSANERSASATFMPMGSLPS